jgi:hypothetical protein
VLTKPLSRVKFEHFRDKLGIVQKDLPRVGPEIKLKAQRIMSGIRKVYESF